MHRPVEYSFATPDDLGNLSSYQRFAERVGLDKNHQAGYGFLHCIDDDGNHWTRIATDVEYLRLLVAGADAEVLGGLQVPDDKFPIVREGWPDEW